MKLPHFLDVLLLELSRDFITGVPVSKREEKLVDAIHIAWARSESEQWARSWS